MDKNSKVTTIAIVLAVGLFIAGIWLLLPPSTTNENNTTTTNTTPTATSANLFYVAVDDNGMSGTKIGCGDSVVTVVGVVSVPASATAPEALTKTFTTLLSNRNQYYGQSGLYNALYQSRLTVDEVSVTNRVARIDLVGTMKLGGACDSPRVEQQLTKAALQFSGVTTANIYINGKILSEALSLQ